MLTNALMRYLHRRLASPCTEVKQANSRITGYSTNVEPQTSHKSRHLARARRHGHHDSLWFPGMAPSRKLQHEIVRSSSSPREPTDSRTKSRLPGSLVVEIKMCRGPDRRKQNPLSQSHDQTNRTRQTKRGPT